MTHIAPPKVTGSRRTPAANDGNDEDSENDLPVKIVRPHPERRSLSLDDHRAETKSHSSRYVCGEMERMPVVLIRILRVRAEVKAHQGIQMHQTTFINWAIRNVPSMDRIQRMAIPMSNPLAHVIQVLPVAFRLFWQLTSADR